MSIMRSLHTPITLGISTLLLLGLVVQYTEASSQVYPTDGIWEDTFDDRADVTLTNCDVLGGAIVLNTTLSESPIIWTPKKSSGVCISILLLLPSLEILLCTPTPSHK